MMLSDDAAWAARVWFRGEVSAIGPLGLLVRSLPPVPWRHRRVEAWILERRGDPAILLALVGPGRWLAILSGALSVGRVPVWEPLVAPILMGVAGVLVGLLAMCTVQWLVDHVTGGPTQRMGDAAVSRPSRPMGDGFRGMRGPFWSRLTPVSVFRRERERDR